MDPQVQEIISMVITALGTIMVAATAITAMFNGPRAQKAKGILDLILSFLRMIGFGTFKDEPGTFSVPLKTDTGARVVDIADAQGKVVDAQTGEPVERKKAA